MVKDLQFAHEVLCPPGVYDCIVVQFGEEDVCAVIRSGTVTTMSSPGMTLADCAAWVAAQQQDTGLDIYVNAGGTGKLAMEELRSNFGLRVKPLPKTFIRQAVDDDHISAEKEGE